MLNRSARQIIEKRPGYMPTNNTLQLITDREFKPSHWIFLNIIKGQPDLWSFDYDDFRISWSAEHDKLLGVWHITMAYSHPHDKLASREELEGFLIEAGMDKALRVDSYNMYSILTKKIIRYFTQDLPDEAVVSPKALENPTPEHEATINKYKKQLNAFLSLDAAVIRNTLHLPQEKIHDESILIMARKRLANCSFVNADIRIDSIKWLHRQGYKVSTSML